MSTTQDNKEESAITTIIEQSYPVSALLVSMSRCVRETEIKKKALDPATYAEIRAGTVTCADMINMFVASRKDKPPTVTEIIEYARKIGVTSIYLVYNYLERLCRAGLVEFENRCGIKGRCDITRQCPIIAVKPTQVGIIYAQATMHLLNSNNQAVKLAAQLIRKGVILTPQRG